LPRLGGGGLKKEAGGLQGGELPKTWVISTKCEEKKLFWGEGGGDGQKETLADKKGRCFPSGKERFKGRKSDGKENSIFRKKNQDADLQERGAHRGGKGEMNIAMPFPKPNKKKKKNQKIIEKKKKKKKSVRWQFAFGRRTIKGERDP